MPVNYEFISALEGGNQFDPYIPEDKPGGIESGVTIGKGVDLGQQSIAGLVNAGVPVNVIEKLLPFIGQRGKKAEKALLNNKVSISLDELNLINTAIQNRTLDRLRRRFDKASKIPFDALPDEYQTVLTSVAHQYGTNLSRSTPKFWKQMTTGDYLGALKNLRAFGDDYQPRRDQEADLFEQAFSRQLFNY